MINDCGRKRWGIFGRVNVSTTFREVRDGLSKTILTGELQRSPWNNSSTTTATPSVCHDGWAIGGDATGFTTGYAGPTATSGPGAGYYSAYGLLMNNGHFSSPGSEHSGGANFGLGDGSVRFYSASMNPDVFALLGSMADGVRVSPSDW